MTEINFFWIGSKVTPVEILAFKSCISNNMTPVLWVYDNIENIPDYVQVKDANLILDNSIIDKYLTVFKLPIPNISDIFRYELLYKIGGIYADTDIIFIDRIDKINHSEYFCSTFEYQYNECANGCLMKIEKESITAKYLRDEMLMRLEKFEKGITSELGYCDLGPFVVQKCASEIPIKILTYDVINPISWRFTSTIIAFKKPNYKFLLKNLVRLYLPLKNEKRGYGITKNTIAVHLCHEMWKRDGIDKYKPLHSSCLYEKLKKRYKLDVRK